MKSQILAKKNLISEAQTGSGEARMLNYFQQISAPTSQKPYFTSSVGSKIRNKTHKKKASITYGYFDLDRKIQEESVSKPNLLLSPDYIPQSAQIKSIIHNSKSKPSCQEDNTNLFTSERFKLHTLGSKTLSSTNLRSTQKKGSIKEEDYSSQTLQKGTMFDFSSLDDKQEYSWKLTAIKAMNPDHQFDFALCNKDDKLKQLSLSRSIGLSFENSLLSKNPARRHPGHTSSQSKQPNEYIIKSTRLSPSSVIVPLQSHTVKKEFNWKDIPNIQELGYTQRHSAAKSEQNKIKNFTQNIIQTDPSPRAKQNTTNDSQIIGSQPLQSPKRRFLLPSPLIKTHMVPKQSAKETIISPGIEEKLNRLKSDLNIKHELSLAASSTQFKVPSPKDSRNSLRSERVIGASGTQKVASSPRDNLESQKMRRTVPVMQQTFTDLSPINSDTSSDGDMFSEYVSKMSKQNLGFKQKEKV